MGCERCERRDERDYCDLDDREKHFLMFIVDGCGQEMIVPDEFLRRFRGEIPREINLETRNGHSYTIGVAKYPDKLVLQAGWGVFVKTYDLRMDDCVVFRYKGNSQFDVIIFDRFGREKAFSVITENAPPVQESYNSGTENLDRSHGHSSPWKCSRLLKMPTILKGVLSLWECSHLLKMQTLLMGILSPCECNHLLKNWMILLVLVGPRKCTHLLKM
uniref:TF-B3 domain-containing protein n=1 Tax=Hordeum vulgare subsp. vulgare TaxID=112509 RepID=A0A8I6XCI9_HORVV